MVVGHTHRPATFGTALEMKPAEKRMRTAIKLFLAGALGPADRVQWHHQRLVAATPRALTIP